MSNGRRQPRGGNTGRRGQSATRSQMLTTDEVLERFRDGPQTGIFTDGSCSGNPGPGGWGTVQVDDGAVIEERYGFDPKTTNNRMEFEAMIVGLELIPAGGAGDIYTDSKLVVDTLTKWAAGWEKRGWRRSSGPVKNLDLVQRAYRLVQERPNVNLRWIRAHDGSLWNEYADALATAYLRDEL